MEEYLSQGSNRVPFYMARQAADELLSAQTEDGDGTVPAPAHLQGVPTAAENDAALTELRNLMGGFGG